MTNAQLKELSKSQLRGNWGVAIGVTLVAGILVSIPEVIIQQAENINRVLTIAGGDSPL